MIWGVEGSIDDHIRHLGLRCYGGSSNENGMTYHVFNKDKSFNVYLSIEEWKNVEEVYKRFKKDLRKDKLKKINNI